MAKKGTLLLTTLLLLGLLLACLNSGGTPSPTADDPPGKGAEEQRSEGAEEQGSKGAGERRSEGAGENSPLHLRTPAPMLRKHPSTDSLSPPLLVTPSPPLLVTPSPLGEPSLEIALRPTFLTGTITDQATGQPISGTLIYVGESIVSTDEEGAYELDNLPPHPVLVIKASGYRKTTIIVEPGFDPDIALEPFQVQGIYIPFGLLYLPERVRELMDLVERTELNAIVVDVKSDRGRLAYPSQVPLAQELEAELPGHMDLQALLRLCQNRGLYTIARMVVFADPQLAAGRPDLAVKTPAGEFWADRKGLYWVDPFRQEVWDYNTALAKEVAEMGFDEVQVDYVRFPSDGDIHNTRYSKPSTPEGRTGAIGDFFACFQEILRPLGVFTSADVFGLTVWVEEGDMGIGQRVEDIAPYVDYLCPMVYPSTFAPGGLGYANPALHPYQVVYRSYQKGTTRTETRIRPWLQHFSIRGVEYTLERLLAQKQAAIDADACGWTFWSARGVYDEALFGTEEQEEREHRQPPP
jgi:hypothetical protein